MDIQKAIEWQKAFKKTYNGMPQEVNEACDCAIAALEKMKPEKVDTIKYSIHRYYLCPSCGKSISSDRELSPKYCKFCGQALDWTESEGR